MTAQTFPIAEEDGGSVVLGVTLLTTGLLVFSVQDVIIRFLSGDYAVHQIVFVRGLMAVGLIAAYTAWRYGRDGFRIVRPGLLLLRGLLGLSCFTAYYLALSQLTMAVTVTIAFASPIVISLLSVLLLKESVGWRRWAAIFVGFAGVVVVVGPSGAVLDLAALLALTAALTYALMSILVRFLKDGMTGAGIAFYQMLTFVAVSGLCGLLFGRGGYYDPTDHGSLQFLFRGWAWPTLADFGLIAVTSVLSAVGFVMLANAYASARPSAVAPFEYVGVLWGIAAGWLVFGEVPAGWTLGGGVLIVGSGLYILARERFHGRIRPRASREVVAALPDPPDIEPSRPPEADRLLEAIGAEPFSEPKKP